VKFSKSDVAMTSFRGSSSATDDEPAYDRHQ